LSLLWPPPQPQGCLKQPDCLATPRLILIGRCRESKLLVGAGINMYTLERARFSPYSSRRPTSSPSFSSIHTSTGSWQGRPQPAYITGRECPFPHPGAVYFSPPPTPSLEGSGRTLNSRHNSCPMSSPCPGWLSWQKKAVLPSESQSYSQSPSQ
jgi:hypothetical protein